MKVIARKQINLLLATLILSSAAYGQDASFDPRNWKRAHAGPPTQVLVLASIPLLEVTPRPHRGKNAGMRLAKTRNSGAHRLR